MKKINLKYLSDTKDGLYVSIYLPTHRIFSDVQQDKIRFKNLLSEAESVLQEKHDMKDTDAFLGEAKRLQDDNMFWNHMADGLAVLINDQETNIFKLEGNAPELVHVGERFHLLPLMNEYEFLSDAYILDIAKDRFKLYHGDRESFEEIETPDVYQNFTDLFDDKDLQPGFHSTGGSDTSFHSHSSASQTDERETEKYLRYVVNGLSDFFKEKKEPIILFGTTEVATQFGNMAEGRLNITKIVEQPLNIQGLSDLADKLKETLLPDYKRDVEKRIEELKNLIGADKGSENTSRIINESEGGRIQTLFIGNTLGGLDITEADQLVQNVINTDGEVLVIDESLTDFEMGIGATFRY